MVLQIMAYFAQTERESIRQRQAEGIAAARPKGKHLGRMAKPLPPDFDAVCAQCHGGELSTRGAAATLGMSHSTFYRHFLGWKKKITFRIVDFEEHLCYNNMNWAIQAESMKLGRTSSNLMLFYGVPNCLHFETDYIALN